MVLGGFFACPNEKGSPAVDAATLARAMGCDRAVADRYVADFNTALVAAACTTVARAAMFCAQVGHESGGLRYMEEIASGAAYEGRRDLGNTQAGDGRRFKGRGPIQLTGRANYGAFSRWCHGRGLVDSATYFVDHPADVATSRWGFLAAAYYWTVARGTRINAAADNGDVVAATKLINGGTNGLDDRRTRWERCRAIGSAILPGPAPAIGSTSLPAPAAPAGGGASFRAEYGQVGAHVHRLAAFLNATFPAYRNLPLPLDADPARQRYGPQTVRAVKEFADRVQIAADGRNVGPQLAARLTQYGFRG